MATWAEDDNEEPDRERAALEWLEAQPAPRVVAHDAAPRSVAPVFVPVNDTVTVSQPDKARDKLSEAQERLRAAKSEEAKAKAEKAVQKALAKLKSDTAKATAPGKVNASALERAQQVLPDGRLKQPRTFPTVVPHAPTVRFVWPTEPPQDVLSALQALCKRVISLGHSSSMVRAIAQRTERLPDDRETYVPHRDGDEVLRVVEAGQLARLEGAHARHRGIEPRILPSGFARYRRGPSRGRASEPHSVFDPVDWIVLARARGPRFSMTKTVEVAETLRRTILRHGPDPLPAGLCGHTADGQKLDVPHVAFVPLPYVASEFADGQILGVAAIIPRELDEKSRRALLAAVGTWEGLAREDVGDETPVVKLYAGRRLELSLRRVLGEARATNLRPSTWSRPSRWWATATPIALDRNPGQLWDNSLERRKQAFDEAEQTVRKACTNIGLPEPDHVEVVTSSVMAGSAKPRHFGPFPSNRNKTRRVLVHARLRFSSLVRDRSCSAPAATSGLGCAAPWTDGRGHDEHPSFASFFREVHGYPPFPWQARLAERVVRDGPLAGAARLADRCRQDHGDRRGPVRPCRRPKAGAPADLLGRRPPDHRRSGG